MSDSLFPVVSMCAASQDEVDGLLVEWAHPLGACNRPFGMQHWVLSVEQQPVACAVSASLVSAHVRTDDGRVFQRGECVELARIGRHPDWPGILRVALRLWRDVFALRWPYWPVVARVSYAMPGTLGDIYRFDGWQRWGARRPSGGSGTWTRANPEVNKVGNGIKTLWGLPTELAAERAAKVAA